MQPKLHWLILSALVISFSSFATSEETSNSSVDSQNAPTETLSTPPPSCQATVEEYIEKIKSGNITVENKDETLDEINNYIERCGNYCWVKDGLLTLLKKGPQRQRPHCTTENWKTQPKQDPNRGQQIPQQK